MSKLRLDVFLNMGYTLVSGDWVTKLTGDKTKITNTNAAIYNNPKHYGANRRFIYSLCALDMNKITQLSNPTPISSGGAGLTGGASGSKKQGKTVWDAVNEYKAYLNPHDEIEFTFIVVTHTDKIVMSHDKSHGKQYICTIEEFNQCVKELERFANKKQGEHSPYTDYNYTQHKLENPLEPIKPRTEDKPVYTQAMKDAGELPSVGMECMLIGVNKRTYCEITYISNEVGCYRVLEKGEYSSNGKEFTFALDCVSFSPVDTRTPEQKQVESAVQDIQSAMFQVDHKEAVALCEMLQERGHLAEIK